MSCIAMQISAWRRFSMALMGNAAWHAKCLKRNTDANMSSMTWNHADLTLDLAGGNPDEALQPLLHIPLETLNKTSLHIRLETCLQT